MWREAVLRVQGQLGSLNTARERVMGGGGQWRRGRGGCGHRVAHWKVHRLSSSDAVSISPTAIHVVRDSSSSAPSAQERLPTLSLSWPLAPLPAYVFPSFSPTPSNDDVAHFLFLILPVHLPRLQRTIRLPRLPYCCRQGTGLYDILCIHATASATGRLVVASHVMALHSTGPVHLLAVHPMPAVLTIDDSDRIPTDETSQQGSASCAYTSVFLSISSLYRQCR